MTEQAQHQPPHEPVAPESEVHTGRPRPLAPLGRAFIAYTEGVETDMLPHLAHDFVLNRTYEATVVPFKPPLLPASLVEEKIHTVVAAGHVDMADTVVARRRQDQQKTAIDRAFRYHPLPEITQAIHLHIQLRNLGHQREKQGVEGLLEAYGLAIGTLPRHAVILEWARAEQARRSGR